MKSEPPVHLKSHIVGDTIVVRKDDDLGTQKSFPLSWKPLVDAYLKGMTPSQIFREGFDKRNPVNLADLQELIQSVEGSTFASETHRKGLKELDLGPSWFDYSLFSIKLFSERNIGFRFDIGFYVLCLVIFGFSVWGLLLPISSEGFLSVDGSYAQSVIGLTLGLSLLGISKGIMLVLMNLFIHGGLPETRLSWRGLMLDLTVDASPVDAHRSQTVKMAYFVASAHAFLAAATLWQHVQIPGLSSQSLRVLAMLMTFVTLNPKRYGETSKIFGLLFPSWKAKRFLGYLENRSLFAIFRRGRWVEDESHLLLFAALCVGWSLSFLTFLWTLMLDNISGLNVAWLTASGTEWISLSLVIGVFLAIIALVLSELWHVLIRNFLFLFQRQIQNWRRDRSIRTEKVFDFDKVKSFLAESPLFQGFPGEVIDGFLMQGHIQLLKAGHPIIVQGNVGTELYMMLDGEAIVRRQEPTGEMNDLAILSKGAVFGEMSLLRNVVRTANVVALSPVRVFVLPKANFEAIFEGVATASVLEQRIALSGVLGESGVFRDLPKETLQIILSYGEFVEYSAGQNILEQGDLELDFYILLRGRVEVVRAGDIRLAEIGPAGFFGEVALFENRPRSATVRALEPVIVLKLSQAGFWEMVDQNLSLAANLQEVSWLRRQAPDAATGDLG